MRLLFKEEKDALYAVRKFNGETADGRTLTVKSVGNQPVNLAARLDGTLPGDGSVDALLTPSGSSYVTLLLLKPSDEILNALILENYVPTILSLKIHAQQS